jgi:hypothetical protein
MQSGARAFAVSFLRCDSQLSDEQQQQPKHQKAVCYHNCTTARSFSAQQTTILLRCLLVRWSVTTNNLSVCAQSPDDWCDKSFKIFDNLFFFSSTEGSGDGILVFASTDSFVSTLLHEQHNVTTPCTHIMYPELKDMMPE